MRRGTPAVDTRAASAALARLPILEARFDRCLLIDDSDEDATQIIALISERTLTLDHNDHVVHLSNTLTEV